MVFIKYTDNDKQIFITISLDWKLALITKCLKNVAQNACTRTVQ